MKAVNVMRLRLSIAALVALAACSSSSPRSASPAASDDAGGDGAAAALSPDGDPPTCASPGAASQDPPALGDAAGVLDATATRFVVFGGDAAAPVCAQPPGTHKFKGDTWLLDTGCGTWARVATDAAPSARGRQAMALDGANNRAVLFGGRSSTGGATYTTYADVWTFDFAGGTWARVETSGAAPSSRANAAAVVDARAHALVVFGGNTSTDGASFAPQNDTWSLDLDSGAWKRIATSGPQPAAREFHAMAIDQDARVAYVLAGGDANAFTGPFLSDAWALDLARETWSRVATSGTGPGGRIEGGLAFDAAAKRLVAFAGHDDGDIGNENDVFTLDVTRSPALWKKLPHGDTPGKPAAGQCAFPPDFTNIDKASPERRSAFAFGARTDGRAFVVFGGKSDCGLLADAWWWSDGHEQWTTARANHAGLSCLRVQASCSGLCG